MHRQNIHFSCDLSVWSRYHCLGWEKRKVLDIETVHRQLNFFFCSSSRRSTLTVGGIRKTPDTIATVLWRAMLGEIESDQGNALAQIPPDPNNQAVLRVRRQTQVYTSVSMAARVRVTSERFRSIVIHKNSELTFT